MNKKDFLAKAYGAGKPVNNGSGAASDKDIKAKGTNIEAAKEVGKAVAKKALAKKIETVVYDRGGYVYHGVVKELAEAAREAGLKF